jgi:hypothetical protein
MTDEQILDEFEGRAMKLRDFMGYPTTDGVRVIEGVRAILAASIASDKQDTFVPCKCESDDGRICGRCHAWDDVTAAQRRAIDRPLTDEQIERIGRMWATKRFNCDDIRADLAATRDKSAESGKEQK